MKYNWRISPNTNGCCQAIDENENENENTSLHQANGQRANDIQPESKI